MTGPTRPMPPPSWPPCSRLFRRRGRRRRRLRSPRSQLDRSGPLGPRRRSGASDHVPGDTGARGDRRFLGIEAAFPRGVRHLGGHLHLATVLRRHRRCAAHTRCSSSSPTRVRRRPTSSTTPTSPTSPPTTPSTWSLARVRLGVPRWWAPSPPLPGADPAQRRPHPDRHRPGHPDRHRLGRAVVAGIRAW